MTRPLFGTLVVVGVHLDAQPFEIFFDEGGWFTSCIMVNHHVRDSLMLNEEQHSFPVHLSLMPIPNRKQ